MISKIIEYRNKPTLSSLSRNTFIYKEKKTPVSELSFDAVESKSLRKIRSEY